MPLQTARFNRSIRSYRLTRSLAVVGTVALSITLGACGYNQSPPGPQYGYGGGYQTPAPAPAYPNNPVGTEYGRVSNIEVLQGRAQGGTSGAGAVIGAVVGGVLGNQVGKGSGRAAATAVGVLGGAVAGNAVEGRNNSQNVEQGYRVSIQLDQGGYRAYDVSSPGDLRVGDRVRLYNGQISRL
ncbi:glycine zipper 2TM domain-containing protein [Acidovorax sp. RAC01]|uniref:glycine zipper 2TM domain-containing protein n=1 Tax=Acidovorax sp. RAC01 TaxID=1842533 RepID=UPI00083E7CF0|nr:glycine zipper 2TM domain-containing protein [Acidovorax sp. RAC01]AOG24907.1 glycine zipper 2TM domain protein [Acidovorax sp. RAC01]